VHNLSLEVLQALNVRIPWLIQLANSGHEEVAFDAIGWVEFCVFTTGHLDIDLPAILGVIPCCSINRSVESYVPI
jgi:hypothetical protein